MVSPGISIGANTVQHLERDQNIEYTQSISAGNTKAGSVAQTNGSASIQRQPTSLKKRTNKVLL